MVSRGRIDPDHIPDSVYGARPLSDRYLKSYHGSDGIDAEHEQDARAVFEAMATLPGFADRLAARPGLDTIDVGSGEGRKAELVLRAAMDAAGKDQGVLWALDADETQLRLLRGRIAAEPAGVTVRTISGLLEESWPAYERVVAGCDWVTSFHMLYYLAQAHDDSGIYLPALTRLAASTPVPLFITTEQWGHFQQLKWHLHRVCGFGLPASPAMVANSLRRAGRRFLTRPIPTPGWPIVPQPDPAQMFADDLAFLVDGNWNCPPLTDEHCAEGGRWVLRHARPRPDADGLWLHAPNVLFVSLPPA